MGQNTGPVNPTRPTLVIADDSAEILDAVVNRLGGRYEIVARVNDGATLVDRVRELQPDLFITDISMPEMSGIEALRQLRSLGVNIPAVILSIHEDEELVRAGLAQGALGFVLKSRMETDLPAAVQEALQGKTFISESLRKKLS